MLRVSCPKCRQVVDFPDTAGGTVVVCPECEQHMRLPGAPANAPPVSRDLTPTPPPWQEESVPGPETAVQPPQPPPNPPRPRDFDHLEEPLDLPKVLPEPTEADQPEVRAALEELPAAARRLGPLQAVYRANKAHYLGNMIVYGLLALAGLAIIVVGIVVAARTRAGVFAALFCLLMMGALGAVVIALAVHLFRRLLDTLRQLVLVFPEGMAHVCRGTAAVYRWDEARSLWQHITNHYYNGAYTGTTHVYTLATADGRRVVFKDFLKNVEQLGNTIANEITRRRLPEAIDDFNAGRLVKFGKLAVSQAGLTYGQSLLPWEEVDAVRIAEGWVSVGKKGKWFNWCKIPAAGVPNLFVFLALVDEIVGLNRK